MDLLLYLSLGVLALTAGYRVLWRRRYGPTGIEGHYLRFVGRVSGPGDEGRVVYLQDERGEPRHAELFTLESEGQSHVVDPHGSQVTLHGGPIRVGDTVVLDATHGAAHLREALYRDAALRPALCALRLVRGAWPEWRRLDLLLGAAALAALVALVVPGAKHHQRRGALDCPPGTREGGRRGGIQWCEEDRGKNTVPGGQDAVKHGPFVVWWDQGQMRQQGHYAFGHPDGTWTTWHQNGRRAVVAHYARSRRVGSFRSWRPDGSPIQQGHYDRHGLRHGAWLNFAPDGRLSMLRSYRHGRRHGDWARWNESGELVYRQSFANGLPHGRFQRWFAGEVLAEAGVYRRGLKDGQWARWSARGTLTRRCEYREGLLEGPCVTWHGTTGRIASTGHYRNNRRDARWTWWHENGTLAGKGRYEIGAKQGLWRTWYENGLPACRGRYRDDKLRGRLRGAGCDDLTGLATAVWMGRVE